MPTLSIAIAGAAGRMGRQILTVAAERGIAVAGGSEAPGSPHLGADLGRLAGGEASGVAIVDDPAMAGAGADVWIDFTTPAATLAALDAVGCRAVVVGTTGFTDAEEARIEDAATRRAIVKAGNFSLGVTLLCDLVARAARALGAGWDVEVLETHHRHKADAPSGTALMLGEAAARGLGAALSDLRIPPYDGPQARRPEEGIGFAVRRAGGVVGDHEVLFGAEKELVSLRHTALDRSVFADGALLAALWAAEQGPGLYDMRDVLGLRDG